PWNELDESVHDAVLHGKDFTVKVRWRNRYGREVKYTSGFEGVVPYIERQWLEAESDSRRQRWADYLREIPCAVCKGSRLKPEVLAVLVDGRSIAEVADMSLTDAHEFMAGLALGE